MLWYFVSFNSCSCWSWFCPLERLLWSSFNLNWLVFWSFTISSCKFSRPVCYLTLLQPINFGLCWNWSWRNRSNRLFSFFRRFVSTIDVSGKLHVRDKLSPAILVRTNIFRLLNLTFLFFFAKATPLESSGSDLFDWGFFFFWRWSWAFTWTASNTCFHYFSNLI